MPCWGALVIPSRWPRPMASRSTTLAVRQATLVSESTYVDILGLSTSVDIV